MAYRVAKPILLYVPYVVVRVGGECRLLLLLFSHELIAKMQSVVTGQAPITLEEWKITTGGKNSTS